MTDLEENITSEDAEPAHDESINQESEVKPTPTPLPESRTQTILRNIIRWSLSLLVTFCFGILLVYFAYLVPTQKNLDDKITELEQVSQHVDSLSDQLDEMTQSNLELEIELKNLQVHITLLDAISDIRGANIAVGNDDYAGALLSIRNAARSLEELNETTGDEQEEVISALQDNLSEIEDMLKNDPEAAEINMGRLIANLINLEKTILK